MAVSGELDWDGAMAALERARVEIEGRLADDLADQMRRYAPVETGRLRDSIGVEEGEDGGIDVVADVPYAADVELGHLDGSTWVPPQPYACPAMAAMPGRLAGIAGGVSLGNN